jgi:hypothetical protein
LKTILSLSGGGSGGGGSGAATAGAARGTLNDLLERLPENFSFLDVEARAQPLLANPKVAPFVLVALQVRGEVDSLSSSGRKQ